MAAWGCRWSRRRRRAARGSTRRRPAIRPRSCGLRMGRRPDRPPAEKDGPSVTFPDRGPARHPVAPGPALLEVARVELPAEYYAKAVPVMTPRVYRLAKLTNKSDLVLLPGEATVYVGSDFVGRMRLPLVAAGEPFIAGFGVDPQLQVSRRLVRKARSVQGGNQIFDLRVPDRSAELSAQPGQGPALGSPAEAGGRGGGRQSGQDVGRAEHGRDAISAPPGWTTCCAGTSRCRQGTIGDKTMYLNYEFRLEYARDLPQPRFVSGGLREAPIGGGAMGAWAEWAAACGESRGAVSPRFPITGTAARRRLDSTRLRS